MTDYSDEDVNYYELTLNNIDWLGIGDELQWQLVQIRVALSRQTVAAARQGVSVFIVGVAQIGSNFQIENW